MSIQKTLLVAAIAAATASTSALAAVDMKVSGQINRGVLAFDDGVKSETRHVDNDASSSRFRMTGSTTVDTTTVAVNFELEAESNNTRQVLNERANGGFGVKERMIEFTVADSWGKLYVGQGATASDGTSEKDLSGTALAGWSDVATHAGGLAFRTTAETLSAKTISGMTTNLDGNSRQDRIRYDSPSFGGLTVAVGHSDNDALDLGLHYSAKYDGMKVVAGLGLVHNRGTDQVAGSVSVAMDNGFNLTLAGGQEDKDGNVAEDSFQYAKVGYKMGANAFSVDYQVSEDKTAKGDEVTSYGVQYVRVIKELSTEAYVGIRSYELEDASATEYEDITAALIGARVKF